MSMYDGILEIGADGQVIEPVLVLSSRGGNKIGIIRNITGIQQTHPLSDVAELSFDVHKEMNGEVYKDWDKLKDFRFVQIPRTNDWFEATISLDDEDEMVKHVTCTHANEAELGQLNLYEVEINTEADIDRDDYKVTKFYNEDDTRASLLHRILRDKAPHYQIYHVDETLVNLFRQFSFNGVSIQDAFNQVAQECNCLFIYGEWHENDGKYHRTISVYDLEDYCVDCGKRGNYTSGHCTNCGSDNIIYGYGEDTGIFISRENLANSIEYQTNTDEVKNCFRLAGGDDIMTAAIKSCNPNKSSYIWYFSDDMLEDMSEELKDKLVEYTELVDTYSTATEIPVPEELVDKYNELVETYSEYNSGLVPIEYPISGTIKLSEAYYNATNLYGFLKSILAPTAEEVRTTTAQEQMATLKSEPRMSRVGIADASGTISKASANSAIQSYAKVFIDTSRYKVVVATNQITGNHWNGTITLKSYISDEDTASETFNITLFDGSNNAEYTEWVKQTIDKAMANRESTDLSVIGLFDNDVSLAQFKERLELYSLDYLSMMNNMATSAITVMVEQGIADENSTNTDVYNQLYAPYYEKAKAIGDELFERETQLSYIFQATDENGNVNPDFPYLGLIDYIVKAQEEVATRLNIENVLGAELWEELSFYRREQEYQNPNFISDGLTDNEIIDYAQKFYDIAYKEIVKSSTLQHTISAPLINFLLMEEFKPLQAKFKAGNWLRLEVDGKLCKLRLVNWEVDYDNIEDLDVEFSDVIRMGDLISDTESILSKARSMSSTYGFIARQADMGYDASEILKDYKDRGLDFSKIKIIQSKGNTNIIYDDDGILLKKVNGVDTLPEQARIYNNGIYITRDAWETVSTGLGHYSYEDPETHETVQTYGIIADTVLGKLILGQNLKIYSESGNVKIGDDGVIITAYDDGYNEDLFLVQKDNGDGTFTKYIDIDRQGNAMINGSAVIISSTPLDDYLDDEFELVWDGIDDVDAEAQEAMRYANDYLSVDTAGAMVANMTDGFYYKPSNIMSGSNVLITDSNVQIRDGQSVLALYGDEDIYLGDRYNGKNIHIYAHAQTGDEGIDIKDGSDILAHYGDIIKIGAQEDGDVVDGVVISDTGVTVMEGGNSVAEFSDSIRIGEVDSGHTEIGSGGMKVYRHTSVDDTQVELANIGYGRSASESGMTTSPYYTMGKRATDTESDIGNYSMVEGIDNTARGVASHVEGRGNTTSGHYSHVEGRDNTATASYTHVGGVGNTANALAQTVIGKYSKSVGSDDLFVIGNGTGTSNNERSTALRVKDNGSLWTANGITSDLVFDSRSDMISDMSGLRSNRPYNFYADGTWTNTITHQESAYDAFGMITRMSTNVYQLFFITNGAMYKSLINTSNNPPTADTQRLYTLDDIKNTYFTISDGGNTVTPKAELATLLSGYARSGDVPSVTGYVTTDYLTQNYSKTGQDGTYAKASALSSYISDEYFNTYGATKDWVNGTFATTGWVEHNYNTKSEVSEKIQDYVVSSNTRFANAVDAILRGHGLIT